MPTYEFACPAGHTFDHFFRKISDAASELPCPHCGQQAARQLSGGAGLLFKGSGFYITDYGKDGKKRPPSAGGPKGEGGESKPAESASESRGESKGESKAEKGESKAESKAESTSGEAKASSSKSGGKGRSSSE